MVETKTVRQMAVDAARERQQVREREAREREEVIRENERQLHQQIAEKVMAVMKSALGGLNLHEDLNLIDAGASGTTLKGEKVYAVWEVEGLHLMGRLEGGSALQMSLVRDRHSYTGIPGPWIVLRTINSLEDIGDYLIEQETKREMQEA